MEVAYVAQTESCVFLLDGDGICRSAIPSPEADDAARRAAQRCLDAQYVASLDIDVDGVLVSDPKPGRQLLFAKVNPEGKVALIRTAILLEMRSLDGPMPVFVSEQVPEIIALDEDPDEEEELDEETSEKPAAEVDDCLELTAPFSREEPKRAPLADLMDLADAGEDLTREDFTKIVDLRERESEPELVVKQSVVKEIVAKELGLAADHDIAPGPVTVAAPRTVRGFPPPPPPIPISSRRGILPRRA
jgi:hypothetical protein